MDGGIQLTTRGETREQPAWGAVFSLTLGVFGLVTAEFLPASLLTPMAASLGITEGVAGQAVTATAVVAMITSLLISAATRNIDRRWVLVSFSVLLIVSNLLVAYAPNLAAVLAGRVLLGIAIGGFWTMSRSIHHCQQRATWNRLHQVPVATFALIGSGERSNATIQERQRACKRLDHDSHFRMVTVVPDANADSTRNSSMSRREPGRPSPRLREVE